MSERDLFLAALDIDDVKHRAQFLTEQCGSDQDRLKRLQHLLLAKSAAGSFLESAPIPLPPDDATATFGAAADAPPPTSPAKTNTPEQSLPGSTH